MSSKVFKHINEQIDYRNKEILITGSTSGIGRELALALGDKGANIYIHGRNKEKGKSLVRKLRKDIGTQAHFFMADFSNMNETRSLPDRVKEQTENLDFLINNAGGYFRKDSKASGFEYTYIVNHLSPLIVTLELIPLLRKSDDSKIVFTASEAHRFIEDDINFNELKSSENGWKSYSRSKCFNIMTAKILDRKLDDIRVCSIHPGSIPGSGFYRNIPLPVSKVGKILNYVPLPFGKSTFEGASMILYALENHNDEIIGPYYSDFSMKKPSNITLNENLQDKLWKISKNSMSSSYDDVI